MAYRLRNEKGDYWEVDERQEHSPENPGLAAFMKRLRGGRTIAELRADMKARGFDIGTGTLHRAIKGEIGNRLESLQKIADYAGTTVDQMLQVGDLDATYWPFSVELQTEVLLLKDEELARLETVMRAHLGLPSQKLTVVGTTSQATDTEFSTDGHTDQREVAPDPLKEAADLSAPRRNERGQKNRGPARNEGNRRP